MAGPEAARARIAWVRLEAYFVEPAKAAAVLAPCEQESHEEGRRHCLRQALGDLDHGAGFDQTVASGRQDALALVAAVEALESSDEASDRRVAEETRRALGRIE
jgi:hypothetical protein